MGSIEKVQPARDATALANFTIGGDRACMCLSQQNESPGKYRGLQMRDGFECNERDGWDAVRRHLSRYRKSRRPRERAGGDQDEISRLTSLGFPPPRSGRTSKGPISLLRPFFFPSFLFFYPFLPASLTDQHLYIPHLPGSLSLANSTFLHLPA
jgi:hypothetical protein